jgi:hypothetical protein
MRIVVFLGAGFSAPFGLPTMNDFFSAAEDSSRIKDPDKEFLRELRREARGANSFLQSSTTNLEDILSLVIMGDRVGLTGNTQGERAPRVKSILERVYTQSRSGAEQYWNQLDMFKSFLGFDLRNQDNELSIITTNYDLIIESALLRNGAKASPGFEFRPIDIGKYQVGDFLYDMKGIPVFKLHGSVNWFSDEESDARFRVEGRVVGVHSAQGAGLLPLPCAGNYECNEIPVIVPPTFLKPDLPIPLRQIWRGGANALSSAHLLVFVGYSFPQSDVEMKYFLAKALADNLHLRKIIVVNKQADQIVRNLKLEGSGFGSHFRELLDPQNADWTAVTLNLK